MTKRIKHRGYYSNCLPGETKTFDDGTLYTVSPKGNWLRQTERKSKKAAHRAAVKAKKENKELDKRSKELDKKIQASAQNLLSTGELK